MSYWSPKPLRPQDPNPLFQESKDDTYTVKGLSPIERQRRTDGTPYTVGGRTALRPEETFYLSDDKIDKAQPSAPAKTLDPDAVVKSFFEKAVPDEDAEDSEKGALADAGKQVGGAAVGAAKQVISTATNAK